MVRRWLLIFVLVNAQVVMAQAEDSSTSTSTCPLHVDTCRDNDEECSISNVDCLEDWALIHCRKTCSICLDDEAVLEQNVGWGQIPQEISFQLLRQVRYTNLHFIETIDSNPRYALCRDRLDMCTFWKYQGHCSHPEYTLHMERECPVSCRHCESDLWRARAFHKLLRDLEKVYYHGDDKEGNPIARDVVIDRQRTLSFFLSTIGMDSSALLGPTPVLEYNWLDEVHLRLMAMIPEPLRKLYPADISGRPIVSDDELRLLAALHGVDPTTIVEESARSFFLDSIVLPYRSRGFMIAILQDLDHLVTRPLQLNAGFAIPNERAIARMKGDTIVQMGAGTGYWVAVLRKHGVSVAAYDLHPPLTGGNVFFDSSYLEDIQSGACTDIFQDEPTLAQSDSLLLIWPNDPDPVDNVQFCMDDRCEGSQAVWDGECLESYWKMGGRRVYYAGEREVLLDKQLTIGSRDSGLSSTRRFQGFLQEHYTLVDTIVLPNWWLNQDDLTVWERKS
jgi:hypothetical protein